MALRTGSVAVLTQPATRCGDSGGILHVVGDMAGGFRRDRRTCKDMVYGLADYVNMKAGWDVILEA